MSTQTEGTPGPVRRQGRRTDLEQVRPLSPTEREWKQRIYERLLKVLDLSLLGSLGEEAARRPDPRDHQPPAARGVGAAEPRAAAVRDAAHRGRGARPRARSSRCWPTPTITDILVNGPKQVYVERRGKLELDRRAASATTRT